MRLLPGQLLRIVCSLALALSAWPARAGVVCVSGGRVVATCGMADPPSAGRASCEKPCCAAGHGRSMAATHCEAAYQTPATSTRDSKAKRLSFPPALLPDAPLAPWLLAAGISKAEPSTPPATPAPVSRHYAPDRGRAPPCHESTPLVNDSKT